MPKKQSEKPLEVVTIYESQSSDGYTASGDNTFFLVETDAERYANKRHSGYGTYAKKHLALAAPDGKFYLLQQKEPIVIHEEDLIAQLEAKQAAKKSGLAKLTEAEKQALGL